MYARYVAFGEIGAQSAEQILDILDHISVCTFCRRDLDEYLEQFCIAMQALIAAP